MREYQLTHLSPLGKRPRLPGPTSTAQDDGIEALAAAFRAVLTSYTCRTQGCGDRLSNATEKRDVSESMEFGAFVLILLS